MAIILYVDVSLTQHHSDKHQTRHLSVHVEGTSSTFISTPNPHSHFQTALTFETIELEAEVVDSETTINREIFLIGNFRWKNFRVEKFLSGRCPTNLTI